jgi:hypothetical protein
LRLCLGHKGLNKRIELEIEPSKDVTNNLLIVQMFANRRHFIDEALHLGVVRSTSRISLVRAGEFGA